MASRDPRIEAVRTGLTPPTQVEGEDIRWSMEERLAHHRCPAASVAVIENGELAWGRRSER